MQNLLTFVLQNVFNMQKAYRFLSDTEPTDDQLLSLMREVAAEAKIKALASNKIFMSQIKILVKAARENKLIANSYEQ